MTDASTIWVVGGMCPGKSSAVPTRLFRSRDAGSTWQMMRLGSDSNWLIGKAVFLADGRNIWVSGLQSDSWDGQRQSFILHSADGGDAWERYPVSSALRLLFFSSPTEGRALWCGSRPGDSFCPEGFTVVGTSDGGRTWQPITTLPALVRSSDDPHWDEPTIDVISPQEVWLFTADNSGDLTVGSVAFHTVDGGNTWETNHLPFFAKDVDFVDSQHGAFRTQWGSWGTVVTEDGLKTWQVADTPVLGALQRVTFVDSQYGWGIAEAPDSDDNGSLVRTNDGGRSWRRVGSETVTRWIDIDIVDRGTAWATGDCRRSGSVTPCLVRLALHYGEDSATQDVTVAYIASRELFGTDRGSFDFVDGKTGWIKSGSNSIARTRDGGQTWEELPSAELDGLGEFGFLDTSFGWAAAAGSLFLTHDGGQSWVLSYKFDKLKAAQSAEFVDRQHGWLRTDSLLLRTEDGGETWTSTDVRVAVYSIENGIDFADAEHGVAILPSPIWGGTDLPLSSTDDGGRTWREELKVSDYVLDVDMLDSGYAWVSAVQAFGESRTKLYATGVPAVTPPAVLSVALREPSTAGQAPGQGSPVQGLPPTGQGWGSDVQLCTWLWLGGGLLLLGTLFVVRQTRAKGH